MYLRKLFFVVSIFFLTSLNANALTIVDCQKRALNAYDNAAAVGGTDADKQKLGSYAANECFKEIEAQQGGRSSSSSGSGSTSGPGLFGILFLLIVLGGSAFWLYDFIKTARLNNKNRADLKLVTDNKKNALIVPTPIPWDELPIGGLCYFDKTFYLKIDNCKGELANKYFRRFRNTDNVNKAYYRISYDLPKKVKCPECKTTNYDIDAVVCAYCGCKMEAPPAKPKRARKPKVEKAAAEDKMGKA